MARVEPKNPPSSSALNQTISDIVLPSQDQGKDGISLPCSPVIIFNPNTEKTAAFNTWDGVPNQLPPTQPAAGANFTYTVPADKRGRLLAIGLKLVTDANVANRGVQVTVTDGVNFLYMTPTATGYGADQAASLTNYYFMGSGLPVVDGAGQVSRTFPFGTLDIDSGWVVAVTIANKQATDQLSVAWVYKETEA